VDLVLTGPRTAAELRENLAAVDRGPLSAEEIAFMRKLGTAVHG
jgi:aryl-alcohol dehydrogenase-like predicted oxidoreductase